MSEVVQKAAAARGASLKLANVTTDAKNSALSKISSAILKNKKELLAANSKDLGIAEGLLAKGKISKAFSHAERDSKPVALLLTCADDFVPGGQGGAA